MVGVRTVLKCGKLDPGWKARLQFNLEFYFLAVGAGNSGLNDLFMEIYLFAFICLFTIVP